MESESTCKGCVLCKTKTSGGSLRRNLQSNIKQMQVEHSRAMMNKNNEHRKALEAKKAEHKEETNILNSIINTAHRWYPEFAHFLRLERFVKQTPRQTNRALGYGVCRAD